MSGPKPRSRYSSRREVQRWEFSLRMVAAEYRADNEAPFDDLCEATFLLGGKEALFDLLRDETRGRADPLP